MGNIVSRDGRKARLSIQQAKTIFRAGDEWRDGPGVRLGGTPFMCPKSENAGLFMPFAIRQMNMLEQIESRQKTAPEKSGMTHML